MKTTEEKANFVVERARELATTTTSWMEFSNTMFDYEGGIVTKVFGRMPERQAFYKMPQYDEVNRIFLEVISRFGVSQGAAPKSGKFVVRVPKTIHQILEVEASSEGVSLNQLAVSKLSVPLKRSVEETDALIAEAFRRVHDGFSADNAVIEPKLNKLFLATCRELGLLLSDYELNHRLFDIRKTSKVVLPPATKRPIIRDYDQFEFASEIAFRFLQRNEGVSLDRVLCDPELRKRFDEQAKKLAPDYSVFKLRKGAFNLRKSHRLKPSDTKGPIYHLTSGGPIESVDLSALPSDPGAYVFFCDRRPLFAGETANLKGRIKRHLDVSNNKGLPEWIEESIAAAALEIRYAALPEVAHDTRLSWLRSFINKEKPLLNYQKA